MHGITGNLFGHTPVRRNDRRGVADEKRYGNFTAGLPDRARRHGMCERGESGKTDIHGGMVGLIGKYCDLHTTFLQLFQ